MKATKSELSKRGRRNRLKGNKGQLEWAKRRLKKFAEWGARRIKGFQSGGGVQIPDEKTRLNHESIFDELHTEVKWVDALAWRTELAKAISETRPGDYTELACRRDREMWISIMPSDDFDNILYRLVEAEQEIERLMALAREGVE